MKNRLIASKIATYNEVIHGRNDSLSKALKEVVEAILKYIGDEVEIRCIRKRLFNFFMYLKI